jgi:transaldolase
MNLKDLPIAIYLDSSDIRDITLAKAHPLVKGVTTNPSLMRRAGVNNYWEFAHRVMENYPGPVSFEVVSEDPDTVVRQALTLAALRDNVWVKVPFIRTNGIYNLGLIRELMLMGVKVNITAIISLHQASQVMAELPVGEAILSVFAGRIADTGEDAFRHMAEIKRKLAYHPKKQLLWASVREPYNIYEASECGADIITVPPALLNKALLMSQKDPDALAIETVQQFMTDTEEAGLTL